MRAGMFPKQKIMSQHLLIALLCLALGAAGETGDCREHEYRDQAGNCVACKQCSPGKELSKECGFGYGDDGQCMTCRPSRFKEDWGFQKCKPCLDCALINRVQKANCTAISNAVCGDCLTGFYRKTKLGGFQEMECIPCGDPPPPYEPHCSTRVNLVKIPSTASSPRDTALAAVICSALAMVLLALLILCVIYCKKQFMEKKPSWSMRLQDSQLDSAELTPFGRHKINLSPHRTCTHCQQGPVQACGPVHLVPSCCFDETCSLGYSSESSYPPSGSIRHERNIDCAGDLHPSLLEVFSPSFSGDPLEACPLMQSSTCSDTASFCESLLPSSTEPLLDRVAPFSPKTENLTIPPSDTCARLEDQPDSLSLQSLSVEVPGINEQVGTEAPEDLALLNAEAHYQHQIENNTEHTPSGDVEERA
uniref:Tumor necrosis factor receptor superfamily member 19 n=1 Tax=Callorhinchus milii TaxID=7868 RepID=V9KEP6_CALMI